MRIKFLRGAGVGIIVALLQACATPAQRPQPAPPVQTPEPPPPVVQTMPMEIPQPVSPSPLPQGGSQMPEPAPPVQNRSPVVVALLADVDRLQQEGSLDQAAARVERGLRISPRDALLWQRLASIRLQQQRYRQVVATAKKSNSLARGNPDILSVNWRLIAEARYRMGDTAGGDRASAKAARY